VELNNQYRELQLAERDEERRILAELSAEIGMSAELILHLVHVVAEMDFIFARAKFSDDLKASQPVLVPIGKPREIGQIQATAVQPATPAGQATIQAGEAPAPEERTSPSATWHQHPPVPGAPPCWRRHGVDRC
jgi:hypothetical protein